MAHSYSRSGGAPTELQHPTQHEYASGEQPLTLPPISAYPPAGYPSQQGHYDSRYQDERSPITLPSIHPHPSQNHQRQLSPHQQQYQSGYRTSHEAHRTSYEGYHPYPQSERPLHLQQSQAQKYATLPPEPYVPSRTGAVNSDGHGRALKKISQRRGERSDEDYRGASDKLHPSQPQPRTLYTNAPPRQIIAHTHQHISPQTAAEKQARWVPEPRPELQERDIRKRSASGESEKMLDSSGGLGSVPSVNSGLGSGLPQYVEQPGGAGKKMHLSSMVSEAGQPPSSSCVYTLTMRQQPQAARACGFGERDRRVIDPPPILQLAISDPTASPDQLKARLKNPYYVVHCSLWSADHDVDNSAMDDTSGGGRGSGSGQRRLMGTLVASPFFGLDEFGSEGCFFCFPDLSCRTTGRYRLKFNMVLLDPKEMGMGDRRRFEASIISGVVVVYAAKDFPGMSSSSKLTRRLKEQGCLISVKKGIERVGERRGKNAVKGEEDGDEEGEMPSPSGRGGRKS